MIPGKILAFLQDRGAVAISGTRDANLIPRIQYVSGWEVESDRLTIRCSIPEADIDNLIGSLKDNGQLSLTIEQIGSHETYQFKGNYIGSTPPNGEDLAVHQRIKNRFAKLASQTFGLPEDMGLAVYLLDRVSWFDSGSERSFCRRRALVPATDFFLRRRNNRRKQAPG